MWALSATPTAHLTSMLQRTHFEIAQETPKVLSEHKKLERRKRNRRNRKHKRNIIMVEKNNEFDQHVSKKQNSRSNSETAQIMGIVF